MKITRNDIRKIILEMNPDGTISPDEDEAEEVLYELAISQLEALLVQVNEQALDIGGPFRAPGIRNRIYSKMLRTITQFSRRERR